jgi:hypothetical protein
MGRPDLPVGVSNSFALLRSREVKVLCIFLYGHLHRRRVDQYIYKCDSFRTELLRVSLLMNGTSDTNYLERWIGRGGPQI